MSTYLKNILLAVVLIVLIFMIKCKLDSNSNPTTPSSSEHSKVKSKRPTKQVPEERTVTNSQSEESIRLQKEALQAKKEKELKEAEEKTIRLKEEQAKKKKTIEQARKKKARSVKKKVNKPRKKKVRSAAKIEFEEMSWDFGELVAGDIVKKKFKFTNTGNSPLSIIGATVTCGCTTPTVPFLDIAPGASNVIGVTYNSVSKEGDQFPELTIETNTIPKFTIIKLSGTVKPKPKKEEKVKSDSTEMVKDTTIKQ